MSIDQLSEHISNLASVHIITTSHFDTHWLKRFSSFTRLQQTYDYMRHFIAYTQKMPAHSGFIRYTELDDVLKVLVHITQMHNFLELFKVLSSNTQSVTPQYLACLMPFIDNQGIIRVGGYLRNSDALEDFKYPILLSIMCCQYPTRSLLPYSKTSCWTTTSHIPLICLFLDIVWSCSRTTSNF